MKNKIDDLRDHLFGMLEDLRDPDTKVDLERMKMGNDVAQTIINSAKAEIDLLKTVGGKPDSQFFRERQLPPPGRQIEGK